MYFVHLEHWYCFEGFPVSAKVHRHVSHVAVIVRTVIKSVDQRQIFVCFTLVLHQNFSTDTTDTKHYTNQSWFQKHWALDRESDCSQETRPSLVTSEQPPVGQPMESFANCSCFSNLSHWGKFACRLHRYECTHILFWVIVVFLFFYSFILCDIPLVLGVFSSRIL